MLDSNVLVFKHQMAPCSINSIQVGASVAWIFKFDKIIMGYHEFKYVK